MNWSAPIRAELPADMLPITRFGTMLGHYDFRVFVNERSYVDVGAGSLGVMNNLARPRHLPSGLLGTIGRFCEANETARISALSEHNNDQPVNVTLSATPFLMNRHTPQARPGATFEIGNNVVLSAGVHVLEGAKIGDGVVVGAGAVVTKELEPYGIYAGAPARRLSERKSAARWWDFETAYLVEHMPNIDAVASNPNAQHRYREDRPRFAILARTQNIEFLGFVEGDAVRPLAEAPNAVVNMWSRRCPATSRTGSPIAGIMRPKM